MLELILVMKLANINEKNALARGRKPTSFKVLTWGLWFVGELIGFIVGSMATEGLLVYAAAILSAGAGGLIAYLLAKNCTPGDYRDPRFTPISGAQQLPEQCHLTITSLFRMPLTVFFNGYNIGVIKKGENLNIWIPMAQNVIIARTNAGVTIPPMYFAVSSGGSAHVVLSMPKKCEGITLLSKADIAALAYNQYTQPPYGSHL